MASLQLSLARNVVRPGESLEGTLRYVFDKQVKLRAVTVEFVGIEKTIIHRQRTTTRNGRTSTSTVTYSSERILGKQAMQVPIAATPGTGEAPVRFQVPADALPNYEGRWGSIRWLAQAKADIAWGLDADASVPVTVEVPPPAPEPRRVDLATPPGKKVELLVTLNWPGVGGDPTLRGTVQVVRAEEKHRARAAKVTLVASEWAAAETEENRGILAELGLALLGPDQLRLGASQSFQVALPPTWPRPQGGIYCGVETTLRAEVDIALGLDANAEAKVEPAQGGRRPPQTFMEALKGPNPSPEAQQRSLLGKILFRFR